MGYKKFYLVAVLIDFIGAIPTVIKAYREPKTEVYLQWVMTALGGLFSLFAITKIDLILFVYPGYVFLMDSMIVLSIYLGELKEKKEKIN